MSERASSPHAHIAPSEARDVLVALRNVEHLAKSPRVGQAVVVELLPEVQEGLPRLASFFRAMLEHKAGGDPACDVGSLALESIQQVAEATEHARTAGARHAASARLGLERVLSEAVPRLEACVEACEMWTRASAGRRAELTLRDVVAAVLEPCAAEAPGRVWASLPDGDVRVVADATVVLWLCRGALAARPGASLVARPPGEAGPTLDLVADRPAGGVPMCPRAALPKVVYEDALASVAAAAGLAFEGAPGWMSFRFGDASALA
ncbi:MAG TPA: hypothetical protein PLR99_09380 [Polyangiaceae bacterium]|nr:hypothetical protein [Polyangiaceae bacterium]